MTAHCDLLSEGLSIRPPSGDFPQTPFRSTSQSLLCITRFVSEGLFAGPGVRSGGGTVGPAGCTAQAPGSAVGQAVGGRVGVGGQRWVSQGVPFRPCLSASGSVLGSSWDSPVASGTRWAGLCWGDSHPGLPALLRSEACESVLGHSSCAFLSLSSSWVHTLLVVLCISADHVVTGKAY